LGWSLRSGSITIALQEVEMSRPLTHGPAQKGFSIHSKNQKKKKTSKKKKKKKTKKKKIARIMQVEIVKLENDYDYGTSSQINGIRKCAWIPFIRRDRIIVAGTCADLVHASVMEKKQHTPEEDMLKKVQRPAEKRNQAPLSKRRR